MNRQIREESNWSPHSASLSIHTRASNFILKNLSKPYGRYRKFIKVINHFIKHFIRSIKIFIKIWNLSLTINLVFLSAPSVPILQEKTSTPITYLERSTHCVRGVICFKLYVSVNLHKRHKTWLDWLTTSFGSPGAVQTKTAANTFGQSKLTDLLLGMGSRLKLSHRSLQEK